MDAPLVRREELLDGSSLDEGGDRMFEDGSCYKASHRGPLSLKRDLRDGIDVGLDGHEVARSRLGDDPDMW